MPDLAKYRKFIVAGVGFVSLFMKDILGLTFDDSITDKIAEGIISVAALAGVVALRNKTTVPEARESQRSML